jgi:outer membrane protein TolC
LSTARAGRAQAEITAGGHPDPTLAFLPEYNTDASPNVSPWTVSLNLNFLIETAGKRQYRLARAQQLSAAARFDVAATAWRIHSLVRANLLDLYAAQRMHALLDKQLTLARAHRTAIEQRVAAGAASRPEAVQAAAAVEQIQAAQYQSERQELADRSALAQSLGVPVTALQGIEFSFAAFQEAPGRVELLATEARQRGLSSRAELLAALADYAASESALQLALAGRIPNVEIGPGYKWDEGALKWSLGIALTLPIARAGPIAEAAAQRNQAAARFNSLQAKVIGEIDQASAAYQLALRELDAAAAMSATAQQQADAAEQQLRAGEADRLTLLEAHLQGALTERTR